MHIAFYTACTVSADTRVNTFYTFYTFCAFCADNRVQKSTQRIEARYGTHLFVQTQCVCVHITGRANSKYTNI